jgi:hypothetical protein
VTPKAVWPAAPRSAEPWLAGVRRPGLAELAGFDEVMAHGMPAYERDGASGFAFASQKQYMSSYLMRTEVREDETARHGLLSASCRPSFRV